MAFLLPDPTAQVAPTTTDPQTIGLGQTPGSSDQTTSLLSSLGLNTALVSSPEADAAKGVNALTTAAAQLPAGDPLSAFLKGRAQGKAVTAAEALQHYEQTLNTQMQTAKQNTAILNDFKKQIDLQSQVNQTKAAQLAPFILSPDPSIAKAAQTEFATSLYSGVTIGGKPIKVLSVDPIGTTGNSQIQLQVGDKITTQQINVQSELTKHLSPDVRAAVLGNTNQEAKPINIVGDDLKPTVVKAVRNGLGQLVDANTQQIIDPGRIYNNIADYTAIVTRMRSLGAAGGLPGQPLAAPTGALNQGTDNSKAPAFGSTFLPPVAGTNDAPGVGGLMTTPVSLSNATAAINSSAVGKDPAVQMANSATTQIAANASAQALPAALPAQKPLVDSSTQEFVNSLATAKKSGDKTPISIDNTADALNNLAFPADRTPVPVNPDMEEKLYKDIKGNKLVQTFAQSVGSFDSATRLAQDNTGASDVGLVFNIMKTFDPTSVVRPSEQEELKEIQKLPDNIKVAVKNALSAADGGTKILFTPQTRAELLQAAQRFLQGQAATYTNETRAVAARVKSYGLDPQNVFNYDPDKVAAIINTPIDINKIVNPQAAAPPATPMAGWGPITVLK